MNRKQLFKIGIILLAIASLAFMLNYSSFFAEPSRSLSVKVTDGPPLKVSEDENSFKTEDIKDIKQGEDVILVLTNDGAVYASGENKYGQLASGKFGDLTQTLKPIDFFKDIRIIRIDMMHSHAIAMSDDGDVYTWGMNLSGQLGNGSRKDSNLPVKVFSDAKAVAAGYRFSAAIKENGELWAWGMSCDPNLPGLTELTREFANDISLGGSYYDGPAGNEAVHCLNEQNLPIDSLTPRLIETTARFSDVSGGYGHLLMLDNDNQAWGFGCNGWGQLGRGHHRNDPATREVEKIALPEGTKIAQIDAGFRHSMAVDATGKLWIWGYFNETNDDLAYGESKFEYPQQINTAGKVTSIEAGEDISGIKVNGQFYAVGDNKTGQIDPDASNKGTYRITEFQRVGDGSQGEYSLGAKRTIYW